MRRILVTGCSGLLGLNLALQACDRHTVIGVVQQHSLDGAPFATLRLDLSMPHVLETLLDGTKPDLVINCAALADLDVCEANQQLAYRLNAVVPGELAEITAKRDIGLVHISTDAVFDGQRGDYSEEDQPNPINVYARTKLTGEMAVASANPKALIARVNFYGWSLFGKRSLAEWFFNNLSAGNQVNGFTDVFFGPLLVNDLADLLLEMAEKQLQGLYHTVSPAYLSKYDFGRLLARQFGLDEHLIQPTSWKTGGLLAVRASKLTLRSDRLHRALGRTLPDQASAMQRFHELYLQGFQKRIRSFSQNVG
ncbi:MAG TPA: SDR family oxidoreductase [Anaerolineaceae bacterium]|nr:SDR family oxidoreductase [Anaerolineaceae bacterium]